MALSFAERNADDFLQRKNTPANIGPNSYQPIICQDVLQKKRNAKSQGRQTREQGGNTIPASDLFNRPLASSYYEDSSKQECRTILEQANAKKPPFNSNTGRDTTVAASTEKRVSQYNPGPGSYSTRISSIKTQFVKKEWNKQADPKLKKGGVKPELSPVNQLPEAQEGGDQPPFFYVRERGGYVKHYQPLGVDRVPRSDIIQNKGSGVAPGKYKIEDATSGFQKKKYQSNTGSTPGMFVGSVNPLAQDLSHTCNQGNITQQVKKQKKWHEMLKSAPSIPKRNKELYVPNYDENEELADTMAGENFLNGKPEQQNNNLKIHDQGQQRLLEQHQLTNINTTNGDVIQTQIQNQQNGPQQLFLVSNQTPNLTDTQPTGHLPQDHSAYMNTDVNDQQQLAAQQQQITPAKGDVPAINDRRRTATTIFEQQSQEDGNKATTDKNISLKKDKTNENLMTSPKQSMASNKNLQLSADGDRQMSISPGQGNKTAFGEFDNRGEAHTPTLRDSSRIDGSKGKVTAMHINLGLIGSQQQKTPINQSNASINRGKDPIDGNIGTNDIHDKKEGLHDPTRKLDGSKEEELEQDQHASGRLQQVYMHHHKQGEYNPAQFEAMNQQMIGQQNFMQQQEGHSQPQRIAAEIKVHSRAISPQNQKKQAHKIKSQHQQQELMHNEYIYEDAPEPEIIIGPDHYNPDFNLTKKTNARTTTWANSKSKRFPEKKSTNPGPGEYNNQHHNSISMEQMSRRYHAEKHAVDKARFAYNFGALKNELVALVSDQRRKQIESGQDVGDMVEFNDALGQDEGEAKLRKHQEEKRIVASFGGPAAYQTATSFEPKYKKEQHQFFGTSQNRFGNPKSGAVFTEKDTVGPGAYNLRVEPATTNNWNSERNATAAFLNKRPDDVFGINMQQPGPQDYFQKGQGRKNTSGFTGNNWSTTIGAFGTTERRFMSSASGQSTQDTSNPGPGAYASACHTRTANKTVDKRVRGQMVKFQAPIASGSAAFKSQTNRTMQNDLNKQLKMKHPEPGSYVENREFGSRLFQGGAPNNFLLTKNQRDRAPFNVSDPRKFGDNNILDKTDPGQYNIGSMGSQSIREKAQAQHKVGGGFSSKQGRFGAKSKKQVTVGPGHANPSVHHYNIDQATTSFGGVKTFNERLRAHSNAF